MQSTIRKTKALALCIFCTLVAVTGVTSQCNGATTPNTIYWIALKQPIWQIFQINSDGTNLQQTYSSTENVTKLALTAHDRKLLFITSEQKTYLLNLETKEKTEFRLAMKGMVDTVLSKDEKSLLFSLSTGRSRDTNHIWLANIVDNKITQLTHMKERQYDPIWSHDDASVFFVSGAGRQNYDIWRLDIESGSLNQLTAGQLYNFEPSCSINDEIAFSSNRNGNYEIWSMDPFGDNVRQLTHHPGMDSQPSWSPDGEHLVFVSNRDGQSALYIMNRDGKDIRRLSHEGLICRNPVWSR